MPVAELTRISKKTKKPRRKTWTYADYLTLSDDKRYEIIEGRLTVAPAPNVSHQDRSMDLAGLLWQFARQHDLGKVLSAPTDVILSEENVVQPDIVFIAKENADIVAEHGIVGPPDLVIEILSPSSIQRDRYEKYALYELSGVKEYWLVDPANQSIEVFNLKDGKYKLSQFAGEKEQKEIKSAVVKNFVLKLEDVMTPNQ